MINQLESLRTSDDKQQRKLNSLWLELSQLQKKLKSIKKPNIVIRWRSLIILFDLLELKDLLKLRLVNLNFNEQVTEYLHFELDNKKSLLNRLFLEEQELSESIPLLNQQIFDEKLQKRQEKYKKVDIKHPPNQSKYPYNSFMHIPQLFELLEAQGHDLSILNLDKLDLGQILICVDFTHLNRRERIKKQEEFERVLQQPQLLQNQFIGFFMKNCKIWLKFSQIRCYRKIMRRYKVQLQIEVLEKKEIPLLEKILHIQSEPQQQRQSN